MLISDVVMVVAGDGPVVVDHALGLTRRHRHRMQPLCDCLPHRL